jgi:hypothetical protein
VNIKTTDRYGFYTNATGTSLAAPHVAGGLAVLLSAYPDLTANQEEAALLGSAVDLGASGPDNNFGYGRLSLLAAYDWLSGPGGDPPPPATPVHVGDLDASSASGKGSWTAKVAIWVHASDESLVGGVTVTGAWSGGYSGTISCMTDSSGRCQVATGDVAKKNGSVDFAVSKLDKAGYAYQSSSNHDPDGDSNGTSMTVNKP